LEEKEMKKVFIFLFVLLSVLSLQVNAELIVRGTDSLGYQIIYDTDLDITWYDYTNAAATWQNQVNWASTLTVNFSGAIYDDWRLPTALNQDGTGPCGGYNCTGSEMGHLYYTELGNTWGPLGYTNTGDFQNLRNIDEDRYWSGTEYDANSAWYFWLNNGYQNGSDKDYLPFYGIAVRTGDVAVVPVVPEPISSTLFLIGAGVLAGRRYFRKKK